MLESNTTLSNEKRPWIRKRQFSSKNPFARIAIDPFTKGIYLPVIIFLASSLVLLGLALQETFRTKSFLARAIPSIATVNRIEEKAPSKAKKPNQKASKIAVVSFKDISGIQQEVSLSGQWNVGQQIPILYDPEKPKDIVLKDSNPWIIVILLFSIGSLALIGSLLWVLSIRSSRNLALDLLQNGEVIDAVIVGIKKRTWSKQAVSKPKATIANMTIGQYQTTKTRSDFALEAEWNDPKTRRNFKFVSTRINFEPSESIIGKKVKIHIDPQSPERYYFGSNAVAEVC